jgi:hypothetical protein
MSEEVCGGPVALDENGESTEKNDNCAEEERSELEIGGQRCLEVESVGRDALPLETHSHPSRSVSDSGYQRIRGSAHIRMPVVHR